MSISERERKVAFYDGLDGVQLLEDGRPVSEVFYLPERYALYPPAPIPAEDLALINSVLAADTTNDRVLERESVPGNTDELLLGTVPYGEILASWPERPFDEGAYRARIELRRGRTPSRGLSELHPGERRPAMALVENAGGATWLRESRNRVALSSRFFANDNGADRGTLVREGGRFPFPADLHPGQATLLPFDVEAPNAPGEYLLIVDLVDENVRWFESGLEVPVRVSG